ncbi:unnamed protein product [Calypogeia fissa]
MMARIGNVGPEAFTRSDRISNGLSTVMRDHMTSSRVDMLLGLGSPQSSSPAFDVSDLNEEDIWGEESTNNVVTSPVAEVKKYDMSFVGGSSSISKEVLEADPFRFINNGRRWLSRDKDPGLSMTYADAGRPRGFPSPLNRATAVANGPFSPAANGNSGRTPSRLIPNREVLYASSPSRVQHQSAPVNVPDWSKILGAERKGPFTKTFADDDIVHENDEDEERLPPHELLAREYARSQVTTFSMCDGAGGTLKGRDQSRVRTAVLRQTGFLNDQ